MKNLKFTLLLTLILLSAICFAACGDTADDKLPIPEISVLGEEVLAVTEIPSPLEITAPEATDYFGTAEADIEELFIRISEESIKADMVCIVKCTDTEAAARVQSAVNMYLTLQKNSFQSYLPLEYAKLKDVAVNTDGVYVYCAVGEKADEIAAIFDKYFN